MWFKDKLVEYLADLDTRDISTKQRINDLITGVEQPSEVVDARGGFPVLREHLDNVNEQLAQSATDIETLFKKANSIVSIEEFGAVGDGVTDDTLAIQSAISHVESLGGGEVTIPFGVYKYTSVNIIKKNVTVKGSGVLKDGKIIIGTETDPRIEIFTRIIGITFEFSSRAPGTCAIELLKGRRVWIENNTFIGCDKAIYGKPVVGGLIHDLSQVQITNNQFYNVNYDLYIDKDSAASWMYAADFKFANNVGNVALLDHVYCKAIDGIKIVNNVMFFPSYDDSNETYKANKKRHIYIGQSDWVTIEGNHLFESGEESIILENPKRFSIGSGNKIAWPSQRVISDAIKIIGDSTSHGLVYGNIHDVIVSKFTGNAVGIYVKGTGVIKVQGCINEYDSSTITYYGTPALSTIEHFGVYHDSVSTVKVVESGNENSDRILNKMKDSLISSFKGNYLSGFSVSHKQKSITATNTILFNCKSYRESTDTYDGFIIVHAKSTYGDNGNLSSYILHISKSPLGMNVSLISEQGMLTGGSENHPSFTFSADGTNSNLLVSPKGSTSGEFYFYATYLGNIKLL